MSDERIKEANEFMEAMREEVDKAWCEMWGLDPNNVIQVEITGLEDRYKELSDD